MSSRYDDIINLPHPTSPKHPRMAAIDRAAQFSPFAALTGYEGAIKETARLTDTKAELDEDAVTVLDMKLRILADCLSERPDVSITYFKADSRKSGGSYKIITGTVKKIDDLDRVVVMTDRTRVPITDIYEIEGPLFAAISDDLGRL